jgi:tagatose-1,6-bisphosphate aldolase
LLKAEFPLDAAEADESTWTEACAEVSTASVTPWILLSAAVDFETYLRQVMVACRTGASGVAVGRAVWKEAVSMAAQDRTRFLQTLARQRLARLTGLCNALAKPWTDFFTLPAPEPDWYLDY